MTIIAYRNGTMACDSLWAAEGIVETLSNKITRLKSGAILGEAGGCDTRHMIKLLNNVKRVDDLPSLQELQNIKCDYLGLLVLPDKTVVKIATVYDNKDEAGIWVVNMPYAAIGIADTLALGAMGAGATARQAVIITCQLSTNCQLPVYTLSLPKGKK